MLAEIQFPQLEEIVVHRKTPYNKAGATEEKLLRRVLESAPNCKSLRINDSGTLCMAVPPQKYGLLTEFECCGALYGEKFDDQNLLPKVMEDIIAKKPAVQKLLINPPTSPVVFYFPWFSKDQKAELAAALAKEESVLKSVLPQLFQAFRQSLRTISIKRRYPVAQLSTLPLVNVTKLVLKEDTQSSFGIEGFWTSIISADLEQLMPRLEELKIAIKTFHFNTPRQILGEVIYIWPECDHPPDGSTYYQCGSIRKLILELEVNSIEFRRIRPFFPNVKSLELKISHSHGLGSEPVPIAQVSECCPDLEELNIHGTDNFLGRNYDADFCGVHQEEAEFLRHQDEDYLKAVQIVPIKPCLLTMPNLQLLRIALYFGATAVQNSDSDDPPVVTSNVTELVALKRMNQPDASISWEVRESPLG